jgi:hypothetical protein
MKKLVISMVLMLVVVGLFSTSISVGYGALHGGMGAKGVISMGGTAKGEDSGLVIGVGTFDGETWLEAGVQFDFDGYYTAIVYGGIATETQWTSWEDDEEKKVINGLTIVGGKIINLDSEKHWMINIDAGYSWGKTTFFEGTNWEYEYDFSTLTFDVGLGYRF